MGKNDVITPEVIKPGAPENRQRAYRIRRALNNHEDVSPDDVQWLHAYVEAQKQSRGASRSHKVSYTEESAEAEGTGDAAAYAAAMAAPQLAKEEGRRIDTLIAAVTNAMAISNKNTQAAHDMVLAMAKEVLARNGQLENVHLGMLAAIREGHLARTNAEADLIRSQAEADAEAAASQAGGVDGLVAQMMPLIIGEIQKRTAAASKVKP